ncbi:MAG TPA: preprotein translocase subunit SecG [Candidatus Gemmiger stercoravium]|uniref:preprotein translocase subunit SecG n=1 Tax=uncultured Subdoligranulum sp. TaxID=512298 RepID=UPI001F8F5933|nr:preprotein translocase subunit SecG [uncultured Subdoligranulum sp.]HJC53663.1 preprotein translocase subunit SecG [Candidatus Gemmiger stercoravium]
MGIYEIVIGVVLIVACLLIVVFTLAQEQKGQGLSAAIMGDNSFMAAGRERGLDAKLAKFTKVLGVIFVVATLLVSVLSARL